MNDCSLNGKVMRLWMNLPRCHCTEYGFFTPPRSFGLDTSVTTVLDEGMVTVWPQFPLDRKAIEVPAKTNHAYRHISLLRATCLTTASGALASSAGALRHWTTDEFEKFDLLESRRSHERRLGKGAACTPLNF